MNPILVVIPYHAGDFDLAKKLIEWINEIGTCYPHSLLLCADSAVPQEKMRELMDLSRATFVRVSTMIVVVPKPANSSQRVWAPNVMFLKAANQIRENYRLDFLWLEPDAIPLRPGWLKEIAKEWFQCPRRFMGTIVKQQGQPGMPSEYLNGVAVYPNNAIEVFDAIASVKDSSQAFDIGSASAVVPKAMHTNLIQHFWGTPEMPPVFVSEKLPDSPKNHVTTDFIKPGTVVFHRSKDGKLIDLLRAAGIRAIYRPEPGLGETPRGTLIAAQVVSTGENETSEELKDENEGAPTPAAPPKPPTAKVKQTANAQK